MNKYRINYDNNETFEELKKYGEINWYSKVLNILFWTPHKMDYKSLVEGLDGVLHMNIQYTYSHKK